MVYEINEGIDNAIYIHDIRCIELHRCARVLSFFSAPSIQARLKK